YCYFFFNADQTWRSHPPLINLNTVRSLAQFLRQAATDFRLSRTRIVLHGGEPLMMKPATLEKLCATLRGAETEDYKLDITLQTNGVLITEEWISVFERNRIGVGVSLDGDRSVNDRHRFDKKGRSSYDGVVRGLRMLQAAADIGRISPPGLLAVVQPDADGAATYRHFAHELGVEFIDFLLPDYTHNDLPADAVDGVRDFTTGALRAWLADGKRGVRVRSFSEILSALLGDDAADRAALYKNDYRHMISVSSNGDIGPEDTLKILDDDFTSSGLNVARSTLREVLSHPIWREQTKAAVTQPDGCRGCTWWKICKAGRPVNRYAKENGFANSSVFCRALKDMHAEACAFLVGAGVSPEVLERRLSMGGDAGGQHNPEYMSEPA
ncbi:MAG TPA: radical SAM protein, partial [Terriglobales bacterium]|nr:radical SAM protein [Terriglobales bacterium]